jgi:hypothetical protein
MSTPHDDEQASTCDGEAWLKTWKRFVPRDAVTCVAQQQPPNDDVVACILLIDGQQAPTTRGLVDDAGDRRSAAGVTRAFVHVYRCDSPETASYLRDQLEVRQRHSYSTDDV